MYIEKLKFQFNENVSNSKRLAYMAELFETLEAQNQKYKELVSGGVLEYQIKHNGQVVMHSFFPRSTEIIKDFIRLNTSANIIK